MSILVCVCTQIYMSKAMQTCMNMHVMRIVCKKLFYVVKGSNLLSEYTQLHIIFAC